MSFSLSNIKNTPRVFSDMDVHIEDWFDKEFSHSAIVSITLAIDYALVMLINHVYL